MKKELVVSPRADSDVDNHFDYIAENNLDAATRFYDSAYETFDALLLQPFVGKAKQFRRKELKNLRMWFVKDFNHYLIFYTVSDEAVEIIRVLHSSRDIEKALMGKDE